MKEYFTHKPNFEKVEFWAATTIFVFLVFFHISNIVSGDWRHNIPELGIPLTTRGYVAYFAVRMVQYLALYLAFLLMNFRVVPQLVESRNLFMNITFSILTVGVLCVIFATTYTFVNEEILHRSRRMYPIQSGIFYVLWLTMAFAFYSIIKYVSIYILSNTKSIRSRFPFVTQGGLIALIIWLMILFLMFTATAPREVVGIWFIVPLFGIFFYWFALYKLIPNAWGKRKPFRRYLLWSFLVLIIAVLPLVLVGISLFGHPDPALAVAFFNFSFHLLVTAPLAWIVFKKQLQGNEEITDLQQKLGRSTANFDFLRSQINPHFLFNALNTIYGTAIQEKAERTSEGIEKLGDMMRFMLQENMQDKIALTREIDYLENYISLQKLRTDPTPDISIQSDIQREATTYQIPPMLLIPFVENAFKHGISFREPSHIKINLEIKGKTLYFDVYNSKHEKPENDPEKNKSGIGLNNVKQRLQLAYPNRHELVIRETQKEFFVHLTIQLS
jgi:hypothetical protein